MSELIRAYPYVFPQHSPPTRNKQSRIRIGCPRTLQDQCINSDYLYTVNSQFLESCQTSIASSSSNTSIGVDPLRAPSVFSIYGLEPLPFDFDQFGLGNMISSSIDRLEKMKHLLILEIEAVQKALEIAARVSRGEYVFNEADIDIVSSPVYR
jgi:hypothetical protein